MNKRLKNKVQKIIDEKFLTDWEFILEVIAPELEEDEFDIDEISMMIGQEIERRKEKLYS